MILAPYLIPLHSCRRLHTHRKGICCKTISVNVYVDITDCWFHLPYDVGYNKLDFELPVELFSVFYGNKKKKTCCWPTWVNVCFKYLENFLIKLLLSAFLAVTFCPFCWAYETFTSLLSSLLSSWGMPGWWGELPCSHSCWSCPACSHSYCSAGLFHREKEKHGHRLRVFLILHSALFCYTLESRCLWLSVKNCHYVLYCCLSCWEVFTGWLVLLRAGLMQFLSVILKLQLSLT